MPDSNLQIPVIISRNEWGQIIDGLTCRAEDYEMIAQYYKTGNADHIIQEVKDADEARTMAEWYRKLVEKVETQYKESK